MIKCCTALLDFTVVKVYFEYIGDKSVKRRLERRVEPYEQEDRSNYYNSWCAAPRRDGKSAGRRNSAKKLECKHTETSLRFSTLRQHQYSHAATGKGYPACRIELLYAVAGSKAAV